MTTVLGLTLFTAVGLVALWPRSKPDIDPEALGLTSEVLTSVVTKAVDGPCSFAADLNCHRVPFELLEGQDQGTITIQEFELLSSAPHFQPGDRVVLNVKPNADPYFRYQYADRERRPLLWVLSGLFALSVVALGRLRGLAALGGLISSVLFWWCLSHPPSLLAAAL